MRIGGHKGWWIGGVGLFAVACVDEALRVDPRPALPTPIAAADASAPDAAAPVRCRPEAPFGAPRRVVEVSDPIRNEWTFHVAEDERSALGSRQDNEASRILALTRADGQRAWSSPTVIEGPWGVIVGDPSLATIDARPRLFFTEQREGRSSIAMIEWKPEPPGVVGAALVVFPAPLNDVAPVYVEATNELWFMRDPGIGRYLLHRSQYKDGLFGTPELDPVLATPFEANGAATFSKDGLTVWFGARPPGGTGDIDIYRATRPRTDAPFAGAELVPEVSSPAFEQPMSVSADGCVMWLTSARGDGDAAVGSIDVFVAERGR